MIGRVPPRSAAPGIVWPAPPDVTTSLVLSLLYQLSESQWWPRRQRAAMVGRQLGLLLAHAAGTVPFYRDRLAAVREAPPEQITPDVWQRIPLLKRTEIQTAGDALRSTALPEEHKPVSEVRTAGSTGQPVALLGSRIGGLKFRALNLRFHEWHGRDLAGKVAAVRSLMSAAMTEAATSGKPSRWVPEYPTGPMTVFDITRPVSEQLDWLVEQNPDYLLTFPSNMRALALLAEEKGVALPNLRQVITMSEVVEPEIRAAARRVWNAKVTDSYSCQEAGILAIQCPDHDHYHVQSESVIVEVLNADDAPCRPGEVGRVVVTDLHNFATPLIRYELGDHAEVGPPCPCGRGLPVLRRVLGRSRNMAVLPNGDKIWPIAYFSASMMPIAPVRQIQLVQTTVDHIDVKLVTARPLTDAEERNLKAYLLECLKHPFDLSFDYVDEIPRAANGKYEDFVSRVENRG